MQFLAVCLGAMVVCVCAMDANKVVVEVGVCRRVISDPAESVADVGVGRVAKAG